MARVLLVLVSAAGYVCAQPGREIAEPYYKQLIVRRVVTVALAFGTVVPLAWVFFVASTCWGLTKTSYPASCLLSTGLTALGLGLHIPFIPYWQLIALPAG
jgi:hypothetical protein